MITKQTSDLELAAPMRIDNKMGAVTGFVATTPAQIKVRKLIIRQYAFMRGLHSGFYRYEGVVATGVTDAIASSSTQCELLPASRDSWQTWNWSI